MHADWQPLYRDHLQVLQARADAALARASLDHLVVPSGTLHYQAFDDRDYPYAVNPQFKAWVPLTRTSMTGPETSAVTAAESAPT